VARVTPGSIEEAQALLAEGGRRVLFVGGGTALPPGPPVDLEISSEKLDRVIEYEPADQVVIVECGLRLAQLQRELAKHGQRLALDPPQPDKATLGGIVAANSFGPLRTRFGSVRDLIIGVSVVRADGTRAKGGGKVVKTVAGFDLPKLMCGSWGTLAFIATVTFRVHPLPEESVTLCARGGDPLELVRRVRAQQLEPAAMLAISQGKGWDVYLRFEGFAAGVRAQRDKLRDLEESAWPEPAPAGARVRFGNTRELVGRRQLKNFAGLQPVHVLAGESARIIPDQQYQHLFETDIRRLGRPCYVAKRVAVLDRTVSISARRGPCPTGQRASFVVEQGRLGPADGFNPGRRLRCRLGLHWCLGRRFHRGRGSRLLGLDCLGLDCLGLRRLRGRRRNRLRFGGRGSARGTHLGFGSLLLFAFRNEGGRIEQRSEFAADPTGGPGQLDEQINEGLCDRLSRCQPHIGLATRPLFNTDLDAGEQARIGQACTLESFPTGQSCGERTDLILLGNEVDLRRERFAKCRRNVKLAETCRMGNRADRKQRRGDYPRAKRRDAQSAHPDRFLFEVIKITSWI